MTQLGIVFLGLSITSSWGNGHATTYRALVRALSARGHDVLFLERDKPWYAANRDLPNPPFGRTELYQGIDDLRERFGEAIRNADLVVVGSYVPDGVTIGHWVQNAARGVRAFYDIDTPVTLAKLAAGECEYLAPEQIPRYDLYLSFTGGPVLDFLEHELHAPMAQAFYCSVDPEHYFPEPVSEHWDLGYLGTYAPDRQPALERLLIEPARRWSDGRFVCAGSQFPSDLTWPANVMRIEHLAPSEHRMFYNRQRFALNVTRAHMVSTGWSPSVRLFEAAACGTPIVSDRWPGLDSLLTPQKEIALADEAWQVLDLMRNMRPEQRIALGENARRRVLAEHTNMHRAEALESLLAQIPVGARPSGRLR